MINPYKSSSLPALPSRGKELTPWIGSVLMWITVAGGVSIVTHFGLLAATYNSQPRAALIVTGTLSMAGAACGVASYFMIIAKGSLRQKAIATVPGLLCVTFWIWWIRQTASFWS